MKQLVEKLPASMAFLTAGAVAIWSSLPDASLLVLILAFAGCTAAIA